jgi:predicted metal-dependent hydrolase
MNLPDNYILIKKEIRHARIRVSEDGVVRVLVPSSFTNEDIDALLEKKSKWIAKHKKFFDEKSKIRLQRNQILLYGNRYNYFYDSTWEHKILIDHDHKTVRAKRGLLDPVIQKKWFKGLAKYYFSKRVEELSVQLNFRYNRLFIRNQRKKWGNCSKEKNISLNWKLIKAPQFVSDYLIVHELVHTTVMNHTARFWTILKSHYPDYKAAINWLDKYGNSL